MQSSTRFITNCDRYYKVRHGLLQIAMVPVHDLLFKVLKHISNHFKFQLQTINELDKLYTKTDMYIYFFRIPHNTPSLFVLKFCISSYLQKLFRKYSVLPIVQQKGVKTASVVWGTQIIAQGAPKTFLSTCPSDKHYFKFGCPKHKGSCPKNFAQN